MPMQTTKGPWWSLWRPVGQYVLVLSPNAQPTRAQGGRASPRGAKIGTFRPGNSPILTGAGGRVEWNPAPCLLRHANAKNLSLALGFQGFGAYGPL